VNTFGKKILTAALAVAAAAIVAPSAAAETDTTPPTVPQNVHDTTLAAAATVTRNAPVVSWDPSTDVGTGVKNYWVLVDGQQRAKPVATTYDIQTLVDLGRITPGPHQITVQAVDFALNRSVPSAPISIVVS
jgi:hypothetical protein